MLLLVSQNLVTAASLTTSGARETRVLAIDYVTLKLVCKYWFGLFRLFVKRRRLFNVQWENDLE